MYYDYINTILHVLFNLVFSLDTVLSAVSGIKPLGQGDNPLQILKLRAQLNCVT